MEAKNLKKLNLPDKPGVYFFLKGKYILYIGKATSLKDRVRSYFSSDLIKTRGMLLVDMVARADTVKYVETDSVLEALILEANEIKKHQPYYNTKEKDDKSFNYVCITKDNKISIERGKQLNMKNSLGLTLLRVRGGTHTLQNSSYRAVYGPFTSGMQLREAMKIIRRLFPYIEERRGTKGREEFYKQIKLFPADSAENKNNIKNIKLFFEGKKKKIIFNLKKEMNSLAKELKFEEASEIKRKIFALNHINDIALIKVDLHTPRLVEEGWPKGRGGVFRIEAYDIAHMGGKNMVGVMTVVVNGEVEKSEYKKFRVKLQDAPARIAMQGGNDTGALAEVLERRLAHTEWPYPKLIVVDGGVAQINVASKLLEKSGIMIPVVSVLKDEKHKPKDILGDKATARKYEKEILLANSEAHRFAINYHKNMRNKNFIK